MFREILEILAYRLKQLARSRLLPITILFMAMFMVLVVRLFRLQIIEGEEAQQKYTQTTRKVISLPSTRGNIYDRNGTLLAYNKLVYTVTVTDEGDYRNGYEKNIMLLQLIGILNKHGEKMQSDVPLVMDSAGNFHFTVEGNSRLRFLRDMYGLQTTNDFTEEKPADTSAREAFLYMKNRYGVGMYSSREGDTYDISDSDALKLINIRYAMSLNSYQKYVATTVAQDISTETMQDVLEHSTQMLGVDVEEDYVRAYTENEAFSHIIGYTGKASAEEIEELNNNGGDYINGDVIGKIGIENYNETSLQGLKGERVMYVDNEGHVQSIESETLPKSGGDVYLTIDADLQVGIYHQIEQLLAGILLDKLEPGEVTILPTMKSSERKISVRDVYFQLINNNVLDMNHFGAEGASAAEGRIYQQFMTELNSVSSRMETELMADSPRPYKELDEDMQVYMTYAHESMENSGLLITERIDTSDEAYIAYHSDETMSLAEFLRYALGKSWVDTTKLELSGAYTTEEETFRALVRKTVELLRSDEEFAKTIYKQLIESGQMQGNDICMALYDQGILEMDETAYGELSDQQGITAFRFVYDKIRRLQITPAQLALDPCSGAVTIIDAKSGEVLAMVSYPGYDNSRISDPSYYYRLATDLSHPLYSSATQTRTAPGSSFKLVSTMAGMEEGIINSSREIDCEGLFEEIGLHLACTGTHGELNVVSAIQKSCNCFFSEVGYELSLDGDGNYVESKGVRMIQKYASMVGLDEKTGIEVTESEPKVSDTAPVPSAIGQGTHNYANIQLARYAAAIATSGTVYHLTLLDRVTDATGKTTQEYKTEVINQVDISNSTWSAIHTGMERVVRYEHEDDFDPELSIAGKTGTAEENKLRPNHATFVGYAPVEDPQYAIACTIPNGFSSTYTCRMANAVMEYVFGQVTLDEILESGANVYQGSISDD